jgi:hypothetical protein
MRFLAGYSPTYSFWRRKRFTQPERRDHTVAESRADADRDPDRNADADRNADPDAHSDTGYLHDCGGQSFQAGNRSEQASDGIHRFWGWIGG